MAPDFEIPLCFIILSLSVILGMLYLNAPRSTPVVCLDGGAEGRRP